MEYITRSFGDNLRTARNKKGLTQQSVADYLGMERSTYTKWELNVAEPSFEYIKKLTELLNVDYNSLFGYKK